MKKSISYLALVAVTLIATSGFLKADTGGWTTDYAKALAQAKAEKKMVLLDFGGSDWCPVCKFLDAEVFSQPKFQAYAKKNLILVDVDFPEGKPQSFEVKKQNADLLDKYAVEVYPTIVVLNDDGKRVGTLSYKPGDGTDAFLADLAKVPKN